MDANIIKNSLSIDDIYTLLESLDAYPSKQGNQIIAKSICHGSDSRKLYYYDNNKTFICYSHCGSFDIYGLLEHVLGMSFTQAIKYICTKFNLSQEKVSFSDDRLDIRFIDKFEEEDEGIVEYQPLDKNILNSYYDFYHNSWLKDGINIKAMKDFNIKFSIGENQIIIPHKDHKGNLIGVRCRNLDREIVESGRKYMPIIWHRQQLNHSLGGNLYGLYEQKEAIKKIKKVIVVESEKSVLQMLSFKDFYIPTVAECGSTFHQSQVNLLLEYGVEEVIIGVDKEFVEYGSLEEKNYKNKVKSLILRKLYPYFNVSIIWDKEGLLEEKDSPTDKGEKIFKKLYNNRIIL